MEFYPFQVKSNGDCLYLAVRKSLKMSGALSVLEMRHSVAMEVMTHGPEYQERFRAFLTAEGRDLKTYVQGILEGEWGDQLEMWALGRMLRVSIKVLHCSSLQWVDVRKEEGVPTVFLVYGDALQHYTVAGNVAG